MASNTISINGDIMSYQNYQKALELVKQCKGYKIRGVVPNEVIVKAEELIGFKFSKQHYQYLNNIGYLYFFGHELYGIHKDDFSGSHHGNMIESTIADRNLFKLPHEWITLYFFDDGYYGYLDYSDTNNDNEPPVIMAIYNGDEYKKVKIIADDLGIFLMMCIESLLNQQGGISNE